MSIVREDGASAAGPFDDDRLMFSSVTQKSSGEEEWDEESDGGLHEGARQDL